MTSQHGVTNNPQSLDSSIEEIREKLAAIEHERWADWQKWMHTKGEWSALAGKGNDYIALCFPKAYIDHLELQIATPYAQLSDAEKASDMEQVDRYWPLIQTLINQKIAEAVIEARIENMGQTFRNLTLHSDGRWTVQYRDEQGKHLVTGKTISEALTKAEDRIKQLEKREEMIKRLEKIYE